MPLPLGPLAAGLGTFFGGVFASIVGWLSVVIGKKAAIATALGLFLIAGWVALQVSLYAAWVTLAWSIPSDVAVPVSFVKYLLPSNTSACIEVVILAKIGRWIWDGQRDWARATALA